MQSTLRMVYFFYILISTSVILLLQSSHVTSASAQCFMEILTLYLYISKHSNYTDHWFHSLCSKANVILYDCKIQLNSCKIEKCMNYLYCMYYFHKHAYIVQYTSPGTGIGTGTAGSSWFWNRKRWFQEYGFSIHLNNIS